MAWILFVIAGQAPRPLQPAEAPLNDRASRQHDEALMVFEFLDDAKPKSRAKTEEPAHALHKLLKFACITLVSEDHERPQETVAEHAQEQSGSIAVLHACRGDHPAEQQSVGVGEHMALAPLDLFARVVTTVHRRKLPAFDALAVDDSGAGQGFILVLRGF